MISCPVCLREPVSPVNFWVSSCRCGRFTATSGVHTRWMFTGLTFSRDQLKEWDDGLRCFVLCPDPSEAVSRHASAALAQEVLES